MLVYTVFAPNAFPQVRNPTIRRSTFKIMVIAEIGNGTKLDNTIDKPAILLTEAWLGIRKKNTAAETIATPTVKIIPSFSQFMVVFFCIFFVLILICSLSFLCKRNPLFLCHNIRTILLLLSSVIIISGLTLFSYVSVPYIR